MLTNRKYAHSNTDFGEASKSLSPFEQVVLMVAQRALSTGPPLQSFTFEGVAVAFFTSVS